MDNIIGGIIGEQEEEEEEREKTERPEKEAESPSPETRGETERKSEDSLVDELSNLWTSGNKAEVVTRFLEMDNETSVKLVFAIGREAALELARMVDQRIEQQSAEPETGEETPASSEPELIEAPGGDNPLKDFYSQNTVSKMLGHGYP